MAETTPRTRGFKIVFPDGYTLDGAQFPSGRVVLDDEVSGLVEAAVSIDELPMAQKPLARIVWDDEEGYRQAIADLRDEELVDPFIVAYRAAESEQRPLKGYAPGRVLLADFLESRLAAREGNHD